MHNTDFPETLIVTKDHFRQSDWRNVISGLSEPKYSLYFQSFSSSSDVALKAGETAKGKALWLMANVCSMMLRPESINDPLQPFFALGGKRLAIPADFSQSDLGFFESIISEIDDYRLKARLADILWMAKKPPNVEHARIAIDSYMQFPLDNESLLRDEAWHRAIWLAVSINEVGRINQIRDAIFDAFEKAEIAGHYHALWLAKLLEKLQMDTVSSKKVAVKLDEFGRYADEKQDHWSARDYFEAALHWQKKMKNQQEVYRLNVAIAESWVKQAEGRSLGSIGKGNFIEKAIRLYRSIPKQNRGNYKADERIKELHKEMNEANQLSLGSMKVIRTPPVDITQMIEAAEKHVRGRQFPEVLLAFAGIHHGTNKARTLERAKTDLGRAILYAIATSTHLTQDGRVAARIEGIDPGNRESKGNEAAVRAKMMNIYSIETGLVVDGSILPALKIVNAEHNSITHEFLLFLCQNSVIIPHARADLWAKGLYYGFEGDFVIAAHLLIPQLEHSVRMGMKAKGIKTTTLDSKGIETENGLSSLLENPEIGKALDENMVFEFQALLTDPLGSNLRNNVAHGLLDADKLDSEPSVYLWWLCFARVMNRSTDILKSKQNKKKQNSLRLW